MARLTILWAYGQCILLENNLARLLTYFFLLLRISDCLKAYLANCMCYFTGRFECNEMCLFAADRRMIKLLFPGIVEYSAVKNFNLLIGGMGRISNLLSSNG